MYSIKLKKKKKVEIYSDLLYDACIILSLIYHFFIYYDIKRAGYYIILASLILTD